MVNVTVVTRREINAFFLSPVAYVVLTCLALAQSMWFAFLLQPPVDAGYVMWNLFGSTASLLMIGAPVLTMGLLSEEAKSGTIEALMTAPVTEPEVVLGKFAGALTFALATYLPLAAQIGFLALHARIDPGVVLAGFMGLYLLTALYLAVGLFCSSLTRMQIAAAVMATVLLIALRLLGGLAGPDAEGAGAVLHYVSPWNHARSFLEGVVHTGDLAYFFIVVGVFLFLTVKSLQLRKWR